MSEELITDRDIWFKEEDPNGAWSLYIYGPSNNPGPRSELEPPLYASFKKIVKGTYIAVPFGIPAESSEITIDWGLPGGVCGIYVGGDCYVLFRYGRWLGPPRQEFRVAPNKPFSQEEIETFLETGRLP
jgi:hypothetical protein